MDPAHPPERRRAPRVATKLRARIWFDHPQGGRLGRAVLTNVSRTGAYLTNIDCQLTGDEFRWFKEGIAPVQLYIPVSETDRHEVRSRIVRVESEHASPHLAVKFEGASPAFEEALVRFLQAAAEGKAGRTPSGRQQRFYA